MSFFRTFTILHTDVPSNQTNFPVPFVGTFAYLATVANGGKVENASGFDIYFSSDAAGSSVLNFERVSWNAVTGDVEFWIQIPTLSSSVDTVIYLQYGNATITTDQSNAPATWDSDYVGVYHFGSSSSLAVTDSKNLNNGTNNGVTAGIGPLGAPQGAGSFLQASNQYIDLGNNASIKINGNNPLSIEVWAKCDTGAGGTFQGIVTDADNPYQNGYNIFFHQGVDFYGQLSNAGTFQTANGRTVTVTNWNQYFLTFDGTALKFYTDATLDATDSSGTGIGTTTQNVNIGRYPGAASDYYNGLIDEVRVSKVARSADYVTTTYNSINHYGSFVTIGTEQVGSTPINETFTDTLTLSDAKIVELDLRVILADSQAGNWADLVEFNLQIPGIGLTDNFAPNWGDAITLLMPYDLVVTDILSLSEGLSQPAKNMNAFNDLLSLSDSQSILVAITLTLSDVFTWTDSTHIVGSILLTTADTFTWSDLFGFSVPFPREISDFFIWRDQQIVAWSSILPALTDSLALSDSVIVSNVPFWTPVNESFADTLVLSDSALLNLAINIGISDTFSPSDFITVQDTFNSFNQSFNDTFSWSDSILISASGRQLQFADQLILSDSVLVNNVTSFNSYIRRYLNDEPA